MYSLPRSNRLSFLSSHNNTQASPFSPLSGLPCSQFSYLSRYRAFPSLSLYLHCSHKSTFGPRFLPHPPPSVFGPLVFSAYYVFHPFLLRFLVAAVALWISTATASSPAPNILKPIFTTAFAIPCSSCFPPLPPLPALSLMSALGESRGNRPYGSYWRMIY
jgi:hypothetical protein